MIAVCLILCQLLCVSPLSHGLSVDEKAFYLSEHKCNFITNDMTGAPILLTAADLVVLGKPSDIVNTTVHGSYSMKVSPQCDVKGSTQEKEIVVLNLGKTKCGSTNVEKRFHFLFFLRKTSSPTVFYAMNGGAKMITSPHLWFPDFKDFCDIAPKSVCKQPECHDACKYERNLPQGRECNSNRQMVSNLFALSFPNGIPITSPRLSTTSASKKSSVTSSVGLVPTPVTTAPRQLTLRVPTSHAPSISDVTTSHQRSTVKPVLTASTKPLEQAVITSTQAPHTVSRSSKKAVTQVINPVTSSTTQQLTTRQATKGSRRDKESDLNGTIIAENNTYNKVITNAPEAKKSVKTKNFKDNSGGQIRLSLDEFSLLGVLFIYYVLRE